VRREAEAAYRRDPSDRRVLLVLARLAVLDGDVARAESMLSLAVRGGGGEDLETELIRAALLTQRGERRAALALYGDLSRLQPPRAEAFFGLGYVHAELGEPVAAHEALSRAVELDPGVALPHFHLARVLFTLNRLEEAFRHLEQSLRLNPWHAPSYLVFARALQAGGELEAAEDLLRQGQKVVPDDRGLLNALSDVRLARGNVRGAVSAAEALVRVEPDGAAALGKLARLRVTERRFREALELCHQLEALGLSTSLSHSVEALLRRSDVEPGWREQAEQLLRDLG
jgi:tetratricopeptide (TPR) repeat protein